MSFRSSASLYRVRIRQGLERHRLQSPTQGGSMRFLLTSAGITNASMNDALVDLLGKPIAESNALCIPTAIYGSVYGPRMPCAGAWRFITGQSPQPMCE